MTKNEEAKLSKLNIYPVVKYAGSGKDTLRQVSEPVTVFDDDLKQLVEILANTVYFYDAVGISAIQVGIPKRVFVIRFSKDSYTAFINPEVFGVSEEVVSDQEGCLSFPTVLTPISRAKEVSVKYQDLSGEYHELKLEGLHARCLLHEVDHLNGVLFTDLVSNLKRDIIFKKMAKLEKTRRLHNDELYIKSLEANMAKGGD